MTAYLLDTNVVSALAPANPSQDPTLLDWLQANTAALFLSVVTVVEIEAGIANAARKGARRKADALTAWLEAILHLYGQRVLPIDTPTARAAGRLDGIARGAGIAPGFADIAIAATFATNGLMLLTRNLRHFQPLGVPVHDLFQGVPP